MKDIIKNNIYIILGIIILNIASYFLFFRLDFTANKRYSLSSVSKNIVKNTKEQITVDFYVTEDLPQEFKKLAREFISLLKEYKSLSKTNFTINIIYPDSDEKKLQAIDAGIQPIHIEVREKDLEKIQTIFIGAVVKVGDKQGTIPLINQETPFEYEITRLLKQAANNIKPHVGFINGHGEPSLTTLTQVIGELSHLSNITSINLMDDDNDFSKYHVLCIIAPTEPFLPFEIELLETYLNNGGRLFIALNHAIGQISEMQSRGYINRTGIEDMLEKKGLKIRYDFVIDHNCGTITINQQHGYMNVQSNINSPYLPVITNFSKHAITTGLNAIMTPFASSIEQVKTSSTYIFHPLAKTSSISGVQQAPIFFNLQKQWNKRDYNSPHNVVAALLTNEDNSSAVVAITDADFIITPLRVDNINFAVNSIEWLADNTGLIQLRNKFTTFPALEPIDEYSKSFLKYLNFLLPILIILIIGIIRTRSNIIKRQNRSRTGYID